MTPGYCTKFQYIQLYMYIAVYSCTRVHWQCTCTGLVNFRIFKYMYLYTAVSTAVCVYTHTRVQLYHMVEVVLENRY